jgi:hypothetical protein
MRLVAIALLVPLMAVAEPASVIRTTDLKQEPATDARTVVTLQENTSVEALDRKGGWTRVKASEAEGWVRMLSLRFGGTAAPKAGPTGATQLFNVARTGTSGTQVTTGIRGLDAEQLATAQPNPAELAKLGKFAADRDGAEKFAKQGKLAAQPVDYPKP